MRAIFRSVFLVIACAIPLTAQWVQTNGPFDGRIHSLLSSAGRVYAGTWGGGVFASSDNVASWSAARSGLPTAWVNCLAANGSSLFAGTGGSGVYLSTNDGASWTAVNTGLSSTAKTVNALAAVPNGAGNVSLFAGTANGVYVSTNNGSLWSAANSISARNITGLAFTVNATGGINVFACGSDGVFRSSNNGVTWVSVTTPLVTSGWDLFVVPVGGGSNKLFVGGDGLFVSTDEGTTWSRANTGITSLAVTSMALSGPNLFAGTQAGGLFLSANSGVSWTPVNFGGLAGTNVLALTVSGFSLFAGTGSGVFVSTNNGTSWTRSIAGMTNSFVNALIGSGNNLVAGTSSSGVLLTTNNGASWTPAGSGLSYPVNLFALTSNGTGGSKLLAGTGGGLFVSTDNGTSWADTKIPSTPIDVEALAVSGSSIFAGTYSGGVYLSTNSGTTWTAVNSGLTNTEVVSLAVVSNGSGGTKIVAGTSGSGVFVSTNNGTSWTASNSGLTTSTVYALLAIPNGMGGTNLFAGGSGVFLSTDNGFTWTVVNSGLTNTTIWRLAAVSNGAGGTTIIAGTGEGGVFLSTNNGSTWNAYGSGLWNPDVRALGVFSDGSGGTNLFVGTAGSGVWRCPFSEMTTSVAQVPSITSFSPSAARIGSSVLINGTNFSTTAADNIVYFGGVRANVTQATSTQLAVTVPAGAAYAPISVTVGNRTAYSLRPFALTFPSAGVVNASSFQSPFNVTVGSFPVYLAEADFDGDGKLDIVVANNGSSSLSVFRNQATPGALTPDLFVPQTQLATVGKPTFIAVGDINGDGKLDLIVCQDSTYTSIYLNTSTNGSITFGPRYDITTLSKPTVVAITDFDGDGIPDIVTNQGIWRNTISAGTLSFAARFALPRGGGRVAVGDFDGDGHPDLAQAFNADSSLYVYRNTSTAGNISLSAAITFRTGQGPWLPWIADFDGDGLLDIAVNYNNYNSTTGIGNGGISLFRNISSGPGTISFTTSQDLHIGANNYFMSVGDLDGDGKPDILTSGTSTAGATAAFRNIATSGVLNSGSFSKYDGYSWPGAYFVIGDLDGDGRPDIAAPSNWNASNTMSVMQNVQTPVVTRDSLHFFGASMNFFGYSRARVLDASPANPQAVPAAYQVSGDSITMEAWVFPLDAPGPGVGRIVLARPCNNGYGVDPWTTFSIQIRGANQYSPFPVLGVGVGDGVHLVGAGYETFVRDVSMVKVGQWTHVAGTYDGKNMKLYINGQFIRQLPLTTKIGTGSTGIYIGGITYDYFDGLISDVRLWNRTRSGSDIAASWQSRLNGNEPGLAGYWRLDSTYTSGGNSLTPDLTSNKNDLIVQYGAATFLFPPGSTPAIAPEFVSLSNTYAVTGAVYGAKLLPVAWPAPTFSLIQKPLGMTVSGDSLFWTPADNQYLSFPVVVQSTNVAGARIDTFSVFSEAVRAAQNQVRTDFTHRGKLGTYGSYRKGSWYKGKNGLYGGDFSLVSRSNSRFSGGLYSGQTGTVVGNAAPFKPVEGFTTVPSRFSGFTAFKTSFTDEWEANRIGVRVFQTVHSSATPGDDKYAIVEYRIVNESGTPISDLFSQLSTDFDIGTLANNSGGYDSSLQMSYAYEVGGANDPSYYGFSLLNKTVSGDAFWFIANSADTVYIRKTGFLTQKMPAPTISGDIRNQISTGPFTLAVSDTLTVAFAVFAGDNLDSLRATALRARNVYKDLPSSALHAPMLAGPVDSSKNVSITPALSWAKVTGASTYRLQVSLSSTFSTMIVNDSTITDTMRVVGPLQSNTTYYWRVSATNAGGTSAYSPIWSLTTISGSFTVSGTVRYGNGGGPPIRGVSVGITPLPTGNPSVSASDISGTYSFTNALPGTCSLVASKVGGFPATYVNAADALKTALYSVDPVTFVLSAIAKLAADVNNDGDVNSADALQIMLRYVGNISSFAKGDWVFVPSSATVAITNQSITNDIVGLAVGDVNGDAQPIGAYFTKETAMPSIVAEAGSALKINVQDVFEIPIRTKNSTSLGSMSLAFQYPADEAAFIDVRGPEGIVCAANSGVVKVAWFNAYHALNLNENDVVVTLRFIPSNNLKNFVLALDPSSQVTDAIGTVLSGLAVEVPTVDIAIPTEFALRQNYPNPFNPSTTIQYDLPVAGHVTMVVYNMLGQVVEKLVDDHREAGSYKVRWEAKAPSGIYFYRLQAGEFVGTKKMIVLR